MARYLLHLRAMAKTKKVDQTADYRSALLTELARVTGGNQNDLEFLVIPGGIAVEDQAPLMHEQFVALRQHRIDRRKLRLIDAALARLDRGQFGICDECDEPIPAKRLNVVPWAAYCVPCQDRMEADKDVEMDDTLKMIA